MKINKKIRTSGIFIGIVILLNVSVFAFSISGPYLGGNQLKLFPGQITGLEYVLQNGGGATEEIFVKAELIEGSDIAKIIEPEKIHELPVGGRASINVEVKIPEDAKIGDTRHVKLTFNTVQNPEKKGVFAFGSAISQTVNVVIGEEPAPVETEKAISTNSFIAYVGIGIIILIIIILLIVKKRKQQVITNFQIKPVKKKAIRNFK